MWHKFTKLDVVCAKSESVISNIWLHLWSLKSPRADIVRQSWPISLKCCHSQMAYCPVTRMGNVSLGTRQVLRKCFLTIKKILFIAFHCNIYSLGVLLGGGGSSAGALSVNIRRFYMERFFKIQYPSERIKTETGVSDVRNHGWWLISFKCIGSSCMDVKCWHTLRFWH